MELKDINNFIEECSDKKTLKAIIRKANKSLRSLGNTLEKSLLKYFKEHPEKKYVFITGAWRGEAESSGYYSNDIEFYEETVEKVCEELECEESELLLNNNDDWVKYVSDCDDYSDHEFPQYDSYLSEGTTAYKFAQVENGQIEFSEFETY